MIWQNVAMIILVVIIIYQFNLIQNFSSSNSGNPSKCGLYLEQSSNRSSISINKTEKHLRKYEGVAVTLFLGSPKWFQNRYSMMIGQVLSVIPQNWTVQIFYDPSIKMAVDGISYAGIKRFIQSGHVNLTPLPSEMAKMKKNNLLLSPWLWKNMLAENVLLFGGTSVLCANSPLKLNDFVGKFDYIGAPWNQFNGIGGSGGLSLRNRTAMEEIVIRWVRDRKSLKGQREDTLFVRSLIEKKSKMAKFDVSNCKL